jgi:hypothetical protein
VLPWTVAPSKPSRWALLLSILKAHTKWRFLPFGSIVIPNGFRVSSHSANTANASLLIGVISILGYIYDAKIRSFSEMTKLFREKS